MRLEIQKITWPLAAILVLSISSLAAAQEGAEPAGPALNAAANNQPQAAAAANNLAWSDMLRELQLLRAEVQALQSSVNGMQTRMDATEDGLKRQLDINDQLATQLSKLVDQMEVVAAGGSGSSGDFVRSIQDDPKLRGDFQKVVQGKVIFDNQTGKAQRIFINGAEWEVIPGRSSMYVPYGQVTIHTRAGTDDTLTAFQVDNWTKENDLLVLNVPLLEAPIPAEAQ